LLKSRLRATQVEAGGRSQLRRYCDASVSVRDGYLENSRFGFICQQLSRKQENCYYFSTMANKKVDGNLDHRTLGQELDLFTFSDLVGSGLPLFTPRGTIVRQELDAYVSELRSKYDYARVTIPHITKRDLYETSGHWDKFAEDLFRITSREGREYALKPMNCPHHTQIFARRPHSYREMPQRYAETTMVYRDEQSGELGGLTRVLSITQDDSHVFCRMEQIKDEFMRIWDMVDTFYASFGFTLRARLSFHDPKTPEKYLGDEKIWQHAENALREIAAKRNADYFEAPGEAALYGPKLDFMAKNTTGREWQVATIQLDFNLPERFDLTCVNEKGEKERIVMIHSAITGSLERFMAVLLEHLEGKFPLWLSPTHLKVLSVSEAHSAFARESAEKLKAAGLRVELDVSNETLGKKVRTARMEKVPYFMVIGEKEAASGTLTLESRDNDAKELLTLPELITKLKERIEKRT
jgi:threonyl-tRNA synthetase